MALPESVLHAKFTVYKDCEVPRYLWAQPLTRIGNGIAAYMRYRILDVPPWYECILLGFQVGLMLLTCCVADGCASAHVILPAGEPV